MTSDDIEELDRDTGGADLADPTADARARLRRIAGEAIGRLHSDGNLRLFQAAELRAHLQDLADRATADGEVGHAAIFSALAATIVDESWNAAADSLVMAEMNAAVDEALQDDGTIARMLNDKLGAVVDELLEAGLARPERIAARWREKATEARGSGDEVRGALLVTMAADLIERFGKDSAPSIPEPFDVPRTLARAAEIADDAIARFNLLTVNTLMAPAELRGALITLGARSRRSGEVERSAILANFAGMVDIEGDAAAPWHVVKLDEHRPRPASPSSSDDNPPEPPAAA